MPYVCNIDLDGKYLKVKSGDLLPEEWANDVAVRSLKSKYGEDAISLISVNDLGKHLANEERLRKQIEELKRELVELRVSKSGDGGELGAPREISIKSGMSGRPKTVKVAG